MDRPVRHFGITGFKNREQVIDALMAKEDKRCRLRVGVLVHGNRLLKEPAPRFVMAEKLSSIFLNAPDGMNLVHFSTSDREGLVADLCRVTDLAGPALDGFQLNMRWPDPAQVAAFRSLCPRKDLHLILQIGSGAMHGVRNDPEQLVERLRPYEGLIDSVLVDPSGGHGVPFSPSFVLGCFRAIRKKFPQLELSVAGGLSAVLLKTLMLPILDEFPDASWDAEGRLHDDQNRLDPDSVWHFVKASCELVSSLPQ